MLQDFYSVVDHFGTSCINGLRTSILKNIRERLPLKISTKFSEGRFPFKPFSILNFGMTEWFFHVTCFAKLSLLLLKSCNIKVITFLS